MDKRTPHLRNDVILPSRKYDMLYVQNYLLWEKGLKYIICILFLNNNHYHLDTIFSVQTMFFKNKLSIV